MLSNLTNFNRNSSEYDTNGAMIYIFVVIFWYSMGMVFIVGMQMLGSVEDFEELTQRRNKYPFGKLRDHAKTKEILGKNKNLFS